MTRNDAIPYVAYVVDDAGCGRSLGADPHAIVRVACGRDGAWRAPTFRSDGAALAEFDRNDRPEFEPLFVAVHSYLVPLTED